MKKLALFLDGTWNVVSDNTNIWRLRSLIAQRDAHGNEQRAYYSTGLGTERGERFRGGVSGSGIDTAITKAYEWLVDNYEKDDEVFIFGFSRGAYTARSLSGFISICGLLHKGSPLGVNQIYKRYRRRKDGRPRTIRELFDPERYPGARDFEDEWLAQFSQAIQIKFIGVFDTVGALGVPFPLWRKIKGEAYPFLNTGLRSSNDYAFHALALDEHRLAFAPTLWTDVGSTAKPRQLDVTEQRWFVGAHANVGGGCFSDTLVQIPFDWIIGKATTAGLAFAPGANRPSNSHLGMISDSFSEFAYRMYRFVRLFRRYYRPLNTPTKKEGPNVHNINETIDETVFKRWREDATYRPPALKRWADLAGLDPSKITSSVRADNRAPVP